MIASVISCGKTIEFEKCDIENFTASRIYTITLPKMNLNVQPRKYFYLPTEEIELKITVHKINDCAYSLTFDYPGSPSFGPWYTSINMIDVSTGDQIIKFPDKSILSSTFYTSEGLESYRVQLNLGDSIKVLFWFVILPN